LEEIRKGSHDGIELWDPSGSLTPIWIRGDVQSADRGVVSTPTSQQPIAVAPANSSLGRQQERVKTKSASKKSKKTQKQVAPKEDIQLEIQIERSSNPDETDENNR
jgi:hypothetical protein